jgi:hypothetical protein
MEECVQLRLFAGSRLSSLSATLLLLNCCWTHRCSSTFINELFKLLSQSLLPSANSLSTSEYMVSKKLRELGLSYNNIHELENHIHCPKCMAARYRQVGKSWVAVKVLRHFPLLLRISRMFSTPLQASYMTWHKYYRSIDGLVRCAADSKQWTEIDRD